MKNCSICHKISASDQDHLDCIQKRSIQMENANFKNDIPEKLNLSKNTQDLDVGIRAILEHLAKKKNSEDEL